MGQIINLTGLPFGRLTVLEQGEKAGNGKKQWICECVCGRTTLVRSDALIAGHIKSCGCLFKETAGQHKITHGKTGTREYRSWCAMKARCRFDLRYTERGILVCKRWLDSFEAFAEDMGECPTGLTLDRKDNNLGYNPENCRWATVSEQQQNTRANVLVFGKPLAVWAKELGVKQHTLYSRAKRGWSESEIIAV